VFQPGGDGLETVASLELLKRRVIEQPHALVCA
jgi:hypothetical protein